MLTADLAHIPHCIEYCWDRGFDVIQASIRTGHSLDMVNAVYQEQYDKMLEFFEREARIQKSKSSDQK